MASFDEMREAGEIETIWKNGEFVDWQEATTHVLTHGLHYGTGVFEGARAYDTEQGTAIFRWEEHLDRLYASGKPYEMEIPYSKAELTEATLELLQRQDLQSAYIRPIAFFGEDALKNGIDVMVSSWRKHSSSQIPTNAKTTGLYVNSLLAGEEARRNGYAEAIVLNKEGQVAEGPGENLFLVRDGEIYTPGLSQSILDGITRDSVITIAEDLGYTVHDNVSISRGELNTADELFFTGSAAEVTPIRKVDNVVIGDGSRGPVTEELQQKFFEIVEEAPDEYAEWFEFVDIE